MNNGRYEPPRGGDPNRISGNGGSVPPRNPQGGVPQQRHYAQNPQYQQYPQNGNMPPQRQPQRPPQNGAQRPVPPQYPQGRNVPPGAPRGNAPRGNAPRGSVPYRPRQAAPRNKRYSAPKGPNSRKFRRPTPFVVLIFVFILLLIIVISTSRSCRNDKHPSDTSNTGDSFAGSNTDIGDTGESGGDETADGTDAVVIPPEDDEIIIYIDPGHGFGDIGSESQYLGDFTEKDMNLEVAKEVVNALIEKGYTARLLHDGVTIPQAPNDDGDIYFYVDERAEYANANGVDLYVSIHCDSFTDESVNGTRVYYCSDTDGNPYRYGDISEVLTKRLASAIDEAFPSMRSTRQYGYSGDHSYYVTRHVEAPSALIEIGFISNQQDALNILDPQWRGQMAEGIANGIAAFVDEYTESDVQ